MPATKSARGAELAEVDVDWLIAKRPGKVKTLKQHPHNKTAINIEYMKASIRAKGGHRFASSSGSSAGEAGAKKNDNQLAMLSAAGQPVSGGQMIRQSRDD
ncbi:hypothetical protein ACVXHB_05360 [Escherichia coli]